MASLKVIHRQELEAATVRLIAAIAKREIVDLGDYPALAALNRQATWLVDTAKKENRTIPASMIYQGYAYEIDAVDADDVTVIGKQGDKCLVIAPCATVDPEYLLYCLEVWGFYADQ